MMNIEKIFSPQQHRIFTTTDARELLPLVYHITEAAHQKVKKMLNRLEAARGRDLQLTNEIEEAIQKEITRWQNKLKRLGLVPKGMWLADFDSGQGYYCWKYPEKEIRYWHGYKDGFTGRIEIK